MTRRAIALVITSVLVLALPTVALGVQSPVEGLRRALQGPVSKVERFLRDPLRQPRATKKAAPATAKEAKPVQVAKPVDVVKPVEADEPKSTSPNPVPMPHIRPPAAEDAATQPDAVDIAALPEAEGAAPAKAEVMPPADNLATAPSPDATAEVAPSESAPFPTAPPEWIAALPEVQALSEADPTEPAAAGRGTPVILPRLKPKLAALNPNVLAHPVERKPRKVSLPPEKFESPSACQTILASFGIKAVSMTPIHEGLCGIAAPVAVASLESGAIRFTEKAVINCQVADALASWMNDKVEPAAQDILGGSVTGVRVAASYSCRGRNNDKNAQLSEHAYGNAIDISAIEVSGHGWIEVGHSSGDEERFLAVIREAACGPFTTVLGPGVAAHEEHFHLDLAKRRKNGPSRGLYCR